MMALKYPPPLLLQGVLPRHCPRMNTVLLDLLIVFEKYKKLQRNFRVRISFYNKVGFISFNKSSLKIMLLYE